MSNLNILDSALADTYAGEMSKFYAVSEEVAEECIKYYNNIQLIQRRIASIIWTLLVRQRYRTVCTPSEEKHIINEISSAPQHQPRLEGNIYIFAMLVVMAFLAMTLLFSLGWQLHVYLYQLAVDPRSSAMPPFMLAINPFIIFIK